MTTLPRRCGPRDESDIGYGYIFIWIYIHIYGTLGGVGRGAPRLPSCRRAERPGSETRIRVRARDIRPGVRRGWPRRAAARRAAGPAPRAAASAAPPLLGRGAPLLGRTAPRPPRLAVLGADAEPQGPRAHCQLPLFGALTAIELLLEFRIFRHALGAPGPQGPLSAPQGRSRLPALRSSGRPPSRGWLGDTAKAQGETLSKRKGDSRPEAGPGSARGRRARRRLAWTRSPGGCLAPFPARGRLAHCG